MRKEDPLPFSDSEPEPDLSVVAGSRDDYQEHPKTAALVVEIAVSSVAGDPGIPSLYAAAGVQEFWIVIATNRTVEVYRQPVGDWYGHTSTFGPQDTLVCESLPGRAAELANLFG